MPVNDIAIEGVETAGPSATAESLAVTMAEKEVGSVVVEEDMEPVGIVTDRDLVRRVLATGADPTGITAETVMSHNPVTIDAGAGILELTDRMASNSVRRMPVVEDGELVGIVTLDDVVALLVTELSNLGSVVAAESPNY